MLEMLNGKTRLVPIIGDPVIYARSPERLTSGFHARGQNCLCVPMEVPDGSLEAVVRGLSLIPNVDGILITMPHKFAAFDYCSSYSETSKLFQVVSVTRRNPDGSWHGDMLDGWAFVDAQKAQGAQPNGARVLLLGAGGAGSAIALALLKAGVRELVVYDVQEARTDLLVQILGEVGGGRVTSGPPDPTGCDMVCNATSLGMTDGDPLPLDPSLLNSTMFVGDVIAGHGTTPFLKVAQSAGCRTANGDQMVDAVQGMMLDFLLTK